MSTLPTYRHPLPPPASRLILALLAAGLGACSAPELAAENDEQSGAASALAADGRSPEAGRTGGGCLPFIEYDVINDPPGGLIVSPPVSAKVLFDLEDEFGTVCGAPGSTCTRILSLSVGSDGAWLNDPAVRGYVPPPFGPAGYVGRFDYAISLPAQASAISTFDAPCPDWTPFDNSMVGDGSLSLSFNGDTGEVSFEQRCVWDHWDFFAIPPEPFGPEDGPLYASSLHHVKGRGQILCPIAH